MAEVTHLTVPIARWVQGQDRPGTRKRWDAVRTSARVSVQTVPRGLAPIVIAAEWPDDQRSLNWVTYEDSLWREVLGPAGAGVLDVETLSRLNGDLGNITVWHDYPFVTDDPVHPGHILSPVTAFHCLPPIVRADRAAFARTHAEAVAADLLIVDGIVHRRSVAPIWTVGDGLYTPWLTVGSPDMGDEGMQSFAIDRRDDARAFCQLLQHELRANERDIGGVFEPSSAIIIGDAGCLTDEYARSFYRTFEALNNGLSAITWRELGFPLIEAVIRLRHATDGILACSDVEKRHLFSIEARQASEDIVEHAPADWRGSSFFSADHPLDWVIAQAARAQFDAPLSADDEIALAVPV
jgi:hypothetical protein